MSTIILTSVIAGAAEVDRLPDYLDGVPMLEHDAGILQAGPLTVRYDYRLQDHIFVFPPRPGGLAFVAAETYRAAIEAARNTISSSGTASRASTCTSSRSSRGSSRGRCSTPGAA